MKYIFINLSPKQGRGKSSTIENFFSRDQKQNDSIFMKHIYVPYQNRTYF